MVTMVVMAVMVVIVVMAVMVVIVVMVVMVVVVVDLCKYILEKTWDRNGQNIENGDTPLHSAAKNGHLDVYKLIKNEYFSINPINNMGSTPFHEAVFTHVSDENEKHFELCKYLIKRMVDRYERRKE